MCGRFALGAEASELQTLLGPWQSSQGFHPSGYNVAPTSAIWVATTNPGGGVHLQRMTWGLTTPERLLINARLDKGDHWRGWRRGVVPATAFYEWRKGDRQPFAIRRKDHALMALAAIHRPQDTPRGSEDTVVIVTTDANELVAPIHHRMPLLLDTGGVATWLRGAPPTPIEPQQLALYPVSKQVNRASNDSPALLAQTELESHAAGLGPASRESNP